MMSLMVSAAMIVAEVQAKPASPGAAREQMVSTYDPQTIVAVLQEGGFRAKLDKDKQGDPMIESGAAGANFTIYFYGCEKNVKCTSLNLHSAYDAKKNQPATLDDINQFNSARRFVRAYLAGDKKNPTLEMDVLFTDGRMTKAMFLEHLDLWQESLGVFHEAIGF